MIQNHILQKFENISFEYTFLQFFLFFQKHEWTYRNLWKFIDIRFSIHVLMVFENNSEFYRNFYSSNSHSMVSWNEPLQPRLHVAL